ncbi:hypothetical protein IFM89_036148 [Coptis chinensis]|uniref:BHLH domain-containing protein n=1 Tax=Coptis chinensis TaxID=261450 RepID=A0A835LC70_9MAGN|nr:hypothetical protein IFM89_030360 [Coptis chinensis]KAF9590656.1 hypothetical protein IFM89_036148 [Coptis chinensis]
MSDKQFFREKAVSPTRYQVGASYMNYGPVEHDLGPILPLAPDLRPFHGVEFQPSEVCPKNFIIFDQTNNRSRIMYHPALTPQKFNSPGIDMHAAFLEDNDTRKNTCTENAESSSFLKEDSKDIDALMSLEEDELEEDDEVVSTARTFGSYECGSPDSCSNFCSKSRKPRFSSTEKSCSGCCSSSDDSEKQRRRMKKMVKALRSIVPGADQMNTATVIDEAVTYLKSLKVEVKKHGLGNFSN